MIDNCTLKLLTGGFFQADPKWSMEVNRKDHCYKVYLPVSGQSTITIDGQQVCLEPNAVYFLSGWHIEKQICEHSMGIYWLHFIPESLSLKFLLDQCPPFYKFALPEIAWAEPILKKCPHFFQPYHESEKLAQRLQATISPDQFLQLQSLLLCLICQVLSNLDVEALKSKTLAIPKLQKGIDFMDQHFLENPSLEEVAQRVHMAPNYFHRLFSYTFGLTPFDYVLTHKLNRAKEMLNFSAKSIKQISADCGFNNEFHFSRIFKKQMGLSPRNYRQRIPMA